ncbi:MAG: carboxymuconolactone decarboxylase family protein [Candidatus Thorarchaeota archaeon]|nr:MAG: carboxymuconolactone decarboxylase family protein [Candidatus Thorarchaeota archaeon]RLI55774.1 MAG: carboxymuconolactone decarboxylase family protein [Candidatus Thorarchaeota archaeon]
MTDVEKTLKSFMKHFGALNRDIPDTRNAFTDLLKTVHVDGALPAKFKEIICIVASILAPCEPCIVYHTKKALEAGATRDEIMEACGVAIVMGGGPAVSHISVVQDALDEWAPRKKR